MTENTQTIGYGTTSPAERNKVLRNTYWLLALSLLPTVLGAYIGVSTGITAGLTGFIGLIVFMAGAFGFIYAIEKTKNSALGVPVLLGFTFFMGLMLSRMLASVLGFSNGASLVMTAFAGTAGVMVVMATLASVSGLASASGRDSFRWAGSSCHTAYTANVKKIRPQMLNAYPAGVSRVGYLADTRPMVCPWNGCVLA